tara:strand:+ start:151435 stop:152211 length:777 start_codon:yes stop_codon:yes gene_type:complete
MRAVLALLCCWPLFVIAADNASSLPRIAIIIDDLGYHRSRGEAIVDLPGDVTCAIIPETPYGPRLAKRAARINKEVMIHLPMETASTRPLDKGGIKDEMTHPKLVTTVRQAFIRIPQARGLNNHMGSILTAEEKPMQWLMQELALNHYFFIDSRTTPDTVAEKIAMKNGLRSAGRDVFLDNERNLNSINKQFNQLIRIAKRRGHAIAIGHPYPETIEYLQGVLPLLERAGVKLVPASELLNAPPMMAAQQENEQKPDA